MIPPFRPATGNLPPGHYEATWDEIVTRFGYTAYRRSLLAGLKRALDDLHDVGCRRVYLNGSFITAKEIPGDFDACWEMDGVDLPRLARRAPVLFDLRRGRRAQKAEYGGDLIPLDESAPPGLSILDVFQQDKATGAPKGIVVINLGDVP